MADVTIPTEVAQLQARVTAAFDAVHEHHRSMGLPTLQWPAEEHAKSSELQRTATAAAAELHAAVQESGLADEHGSFAVQAALMAASRAQ